MTTALRGLLALVAITAVATLPHMAFDEVVSEMDLVETVSGEPHPLHPTVPSLGEALQDDSGSPPSRDSVGSQNLIRVCGGRRGSA
jgi:hypothetical protein